MTKELNEEVERLRKHVWDTLEGNSPSDLYSTVRVAGFSDAAVREVIARMQKGHWYVEDAREFPTPHILVAVKGTEAGGYGAYLRDRSVKG